MEQTAISKARVKCPGCRRLFEFDDENRGCATKCPKCQCDFLIPEDGAEGLLLGVGSDCFDIVCPHCKTEFVLPNEYRGEIADCADCHGVFLIPDEGNEGVPADDETEGAMGATPATTAPDKTHTHAGQEGSVQRRSATVFLSRKEVLDQAEKAQRERMGRLAQPIGIQRAGEQASASEPEVETDQTGRPIIDLKTSPLLEPVLGRAIRRSELPLWLPALDFEKREKIVEFEPGAEPPMKALKLATLAPVLLIPGAAALCLFLHPAAAAAICFVPGLVCWGIAASKLLPVLGRKALILTNFRVIMADHYEVVDIDLL
jgi:Zn-finger nucleic acid-binding protein